MARVELIAELATNHGGDIELAKRMIQAAAEAGADWVKTQGYRTKHLRQSDPQFAWFKQCELDDGAHIELMEYASACGVKYLSTAYHSEDLTRLKALGLEAVKIGSGEGRSWLVGSAANRFRRVYATVPWGEGARDILSVPRDEYDIARKVGNITWLATVPLYPAPLEAYSRITRQYGYSDHHVGLTVAKMAIAQGARVIEKHFHIDGCPAHRQQSWNMTPESLRELRTWAEECAQALDGTKWEGRWSA